MKRRQRHSQRYAKGTKGSKDPAHSDRGLRLLPYPIRENLPILGSQQGQGGKAKALARCFTAGGSASWYVTEGSARRNREGKAVDYLLYGLVEGDRRTLDYFWLSDLITIRSPAGLPVQRDTHWQPRTLEEIAPEMFRTHEKEQED